MAVDNKKLGSLFGTKQQNKESAADSRNAMYLKNSASRAATFADQALGELSDTSWRQTTDSATRAAHAKAVAAFKAAEAAAKQLSNLASYIR